MYECIIRDLQDLKGSEADEQSRHAAIHYWKRIELKLKCRGEELPLPIKTLLRELEQIAFGQNQLSAA